jgi:serine/threonine protein kinase
MGNINDELILGEQIAEGGFGKIYKAHYAKFNIDLALKCESLKTGVPQLYHEFGIYQLLTQTGVTRIPGLPLVYSINRNEDCNYMVMELVGPSLEKVRREQGNLTLREVAHLGKSLLQTLEIIHAKGIIHRDIKPDNIAFGCTESAYKYYLLDFGLAKKFIGFNGDHVPRTKNCCVPGTPVYASLDVNSGIVASRKDDIESLIYTIIMLHNGRLPWEPKRLMNLYDGHKEAFLTKSKVPISQLCAGLPTELEDALTYCRNLGFNQAPDYNYLRSLFTKMETSALK